MKHRMMSPYFSPFRWIESGRDDLKEIDYKKLKRRVLARFDLNENQPILIQGRWINRGEAIKYLEELKDENLFSFHKTIFLNKPLLYFLETGKLDNVQKDNRIEDQELLRFMTPFLESSIDEFYLFHLRNKQLNYTDTDNIIKLIPPETLNQLELKRTKNYLFSEILLAENLATKLQSKKFKAYSNYIDKHISNSYFKQLNYLPASFQFFRDKLANTVLNISYYLIEIHQNLIAARKILNKASHLHCDKEIKKLINGNYNAAKSSNKSHWYLIVVFIFAIRFIISPSISKSGKEHKVLSSKQMDRFFQVKSFEKIKQFHLVNNLSQNAITEIENGFVFYAKTNLKREYPLKITNKTPYDVVVLVQSNVMLFNGKGIVDKCVYIKSYKEVNIDVKKNNGLKLTFYAGDDPSRASCSFCSIFDVTKGVSFKSPYGVGEAFTTSLNQFSIEESTIRPFNSLIHE